MPGSTMEDTPKFDLSDRAFEPRGAAVHDARESCWYARTNFGIVALRYEEVRNLLRDKRVRQGLYAWPQQNGINEGLLAEWFPDVLLMMEGEDHRRLRRLINPIFAPSAIEPLAADFQALTHELIDGFAAAGECEFMSAFAEPYAARVLLHLMGLPEDGWQHVAKLVAQLGEAFGVDVVRELPKIEAALAELLEIADDTVAERRRNPGEDVVSMLVAARDGDDKLTEQEMRVLIVTFFLAGIDTTKSQFGLALLAFMRNSEQWALLADRPELAADAVEEAMRVSPTVVWITREAIEDFEVNGLPIPAGTTIHVFTEAANTDPRVSAGTLFDITGERPRQLGFGAGPHHCVGHYLSRVDMREAMPILAQRLRNPRLLADPELRPESGTTGPISLRVGFDPAAAAG